MAPQSTDNPAFISPSPSQEIRFPLWGAVPPLLPRNSRVIAFYCAQSEGLNPLIAGLVRSRPVDLELISAPCRSAFREIAPVLSRNALRPRIRFCPPLLALSSISFPITFVFRAFPGRSHYRLISLFPVFVFSSCAGNLCLLSSPAPVFLVHSLARSLPILRSNRFSAYFFRDIGFPSPVTSASPKALRWHSYSPPKIPGKFLVPFRVAMMRYLFLLAPSSLPPLSFMIILAPPLNCSVIMF